MPTLLIPNTTVQVLGPDGQFTLPWRRYLERLGGGGTIGPEGPPGPEGPEGPEGPPGEDEASLLALLGAVGLDQPPGTLVWPSSGPPGNDGDDGQDGPPGPPGIPGAAGAAGATGPQGVPGQPGMDGEEGPEGFAIPGPTGAAGAAGATGATGPQGPIGFALDGETGEDSYIAGPAGSPGQSGAVVLLSEVVTSASQSSVTFSGISSNYRDLIVIVRGQLSASADIVLQFNGDTGNNYIWDFLRQQNVTVSGLAGASPQSSILAGEIAVVANIAGSVETRIYDYRGTTFTKVTNSSFSQFSGTAAANLFVGITSGMWNNTAAITSVKVFLDTAAHFVDNSVVSLYGST